MTPGRAHGQEMLAVQIAADNLITQRSGSGCLSMNMGLHGSKPVSKAPEDC